MPILTIISVLFILYKIIEFPFKLVHAFITGYKDGKEKMKKARQNNGRPTRRVFQDSVKAND